MAKKIISLVVALVMVFSLAISSVSASAICLNKDAAKDLWSKTFTGRVYNAIFGDKDDVAADEVIVDAEEETTKFEPFKAYFKYDVEKTLKYGFQIGNVPTTEAPVIEDVTDETPAVSEEATTVEQIVEETEAVEITEETPLADVEQIANTGDAGVATIVALSAVSAAAFVVAKKK